MIHIIYIYFILNAITVGMYIGQHSGDSIITIIFLLLILALIGGPLELASIIWNNGRDLVFKINDYFQIVFWWRFYFTNKFQSETFDNLNKLNKFANSQESKMIRRVVAKLNKRNNFTYIQAPK